MKKNIIWFKDIRLKDIALVGGKNASLGEMMEPLKKQGVIVPDGFAITTNAYKSFIKYKKISEDIKLEIKAAYKKLGGANKEISVAVRSSATAEDLAGASFAGEYDTYLNVKGEIELLSAVEKCFASLFTERAISYRKDKGIREKNIAMSVGVQKMINSASSGVMFTGDIETGFDKVAVIESVAGSPEAVVRGSSNPDKFVVFKPAIQEGLNGIISKAGNSLLDKEAANLAKIGIAIEKHFGKLYGTPKIMDIEWAKGKKGEFYILQARQETVLSRASKNVDEEYVLNNKFGAKEISTGIAVGRKIAYGRVQIIKDVNKINEFKKGSILVTNILSPNWEPIMRKAAGIVADKGGRTSHGAIVARELGVPCIVGAGTATKLLKNGDMITLDASSGDEGRVYKGNLPFKVVRQNLTNVPRLKTQIMLTVGSPEEAFKNANLPVRGVGLGRLEFIINSSIGIHPNKLIKDGKEDFYVDKLKAGISKIAAAFYPNDIIIRFSDFKTNEHRTMAGGEKFEPIEENPMIGLRGASRYYHPDFQKAFELECKAIKGVRDELGIKNIIPMVPFCRTPEEGRKVVDIMAKNGLGRKKDKGLKIYAMCEIPSNVILADEFLDVFDGMSIGLNDLTQLIAGIDRDSEILSKIANETHPAVRRAIKDVIKKCQARNKYIGICWQSPPDHPDFLNDLVRAGISSISVNSDAVIKTIRLAAKAEKKLK